MKPEHLLGGHAAGILTEEEKQALYGAALKDQALFDTLMDEEALRELLADPSAREALLQSLEAPKPLPRPWWKRPLPLSLAASLLLVLGSTLLVERPLGRQEKLAEPLRRTSEPLHESMEEKPPPVVAPSVASPPATPSRARGLTCTLQPNRAGTRTLVVRWEAPGHLALVQRGGAQDLVLSPHLKAPHRAEIQVDPQAGPWVDVYLLPTPTPRPETLPPGPPPGGLHRRVDLRSPKGV